MKIKFIIASVFSLFMVLSCDKKQPNDAETNKVETIETTKVVTVKDSVRADGTSISVGSDGVSVENQNGDNKLDVNVDKNGTQVEVRK